MQRLEKVDGYHLVLASVRPVLQKSTLPRGVEHGIFRIMFIFSTKRCL